MPDRSPSIPAPSLEFSLKASARPLCLRPRVPFPLCAEQGRAALARSLRGAATRDADIHPGLGANPKSDAALWGHSWNMREKTRLRTSRRRHTGIHWEYLPQGSGFGSGMVCRRRLAAWNEAGVWDRLHVVLLKELRSKNQLDWSRAAIDSSHVRAARRGPKAAPARSTAHGRAVSTTSSPTARSSRSRCR